LLLLRTICPNGAPLFGKGTKQRMNDVSLV
jgi:hypothetical protein